jgi:hypothetical protein
VRKLFGPILYFLDIKYIKFFDDTLANSMLKCNEEKDLNYDPESPDDGLNKYQKTKWLVLFRGR